MKLFELFATLTIDTSEFEKGVKSAQKEVKGFSKLSAMSASDASQKLEKLGKKAISIGKTVAVGATAIFSAVGAFAKKSLDEYADREQLVGGVETLFKDAAGTVERYARTAYKTAGMSANQYMETVTSFSARLMQGLGGDTKEAAEMANLAITDMSDNANKMGTDMASIEYAYQGFAKQNYTMLDNLKLGYGGTASEMARLINDSGVLGKTMTVTANNLNDVSFDTIIRAIHEIQTNMGITGTTAEEAEDTISGSFNTMKASWQNLLAGMSMDDSKIAHIRREEAFTESVETWLSNIKEPILNFIENLPDTLSAVLPAATDAAFDVGAAIIAEIYNGLTGSDITSDDVSGVLNNIATSAGDALTNTTSFLNDLLTWMQTNGVSFKDSLTIITGALLAFKNAANPKGTIIGLALTGLSLIITNWDDVKKIAGAAWDTIKGFFSETVPAAFTNAIEGLIDIWNNVKNAVVGVYNEITKLFSIDQPVVAEGQTFGNTEAYNAVNAWTDSLLTEDEIAKQNAWATAQAALGGAEAASTFSNAYVIWLERNGLDFGARVPASWFEGAEEAIKGSLDDMDLEAPLDAAWDGATGEILQDGLNKMNLSAPISVRPSLALGSGGIVSQFNDIDTSKLIPGHASGLDYVPYDDYIARLHQGEMVLTKNEANMWRSGQSGQQVNIAAITAAVANAIAERPVAINIDGKAFAAMTAKEMNRAIGNRNIQTIMGMGG